MEELTQVRHILLIYTLGVTRMMACFVILPLLSKKMLGGTVIRNGVVGSLGLFLYPIVAGEDLGHDLDALTIFAIILKEGAVGLMIGFCAAAPFWAVESCGFFIDNQRGATLASNINPALESESSPTGIILTQTLITLFFVTGSFLFFLEALFKSYITWPILSFYPEFTADRALFFMEQLGMTMKICVLTAAPVIIAMFLAEFGLALISRFAPSMNVFFLALPIKSGVASFILIVYIVILMNFFTDELFHLPYLFNSLSEIWQP